MAGIDRYTGQPIDGWPNVAQKLALLFATHIGSRFMRRTVGSAVPALLGRSLTAATVLRFKTALIVCTELWEPRFKITRVDSLADTNTPESLRLGHLAIEIVGEYRPRAQFGDLSTDTLERTMVVGRSSSGNIEAA